MSRKIFYIIILNLVLICGCKTSMELNNRSQLEDPLNTGEIILLTKDGGEYKLFFYNPTDSVLFGKGKIKVKGIYKDFNGNIPVKNIAYIYTSNTNIMKTLVVTGLAVFFSLSMGDIISNFQTKSFSIAPKEGTYYPGSCPAVYSHDGQNEYYESETFAGAIFKKAEREAYDILNHLKPVDGMYKLKIKNERPETDYINEVKLIAYDLPKGVRIIPDMNGEAVTISNPLTPNKCEDFSGNNITASIINNDSLFYESNLSKKDFSNEEDLKDGLILEFNKPLKARKAKLVINAINTRLLNFAFEKLQELKGKDILKWYNDLDNNEIERMKLFNFFLRDGTLRIKIWQDGKWKNAGIMMYVGPDIQKEQIAILDISNIANDILKIKIESTIGLWKINNAFIDYSPPAVKEKKVLNPEKVIDDNGKDITGLLLFDDDKYYSTICGNYAEMHFREPGLKSGLDRHIILKTKGYYLQWFNLSDNEPNKNYDKVLSEPLYGLRTYLPEWKKRLSGK